MLIVVDFYERVVIILYRHSVIVGEDAIGDI